MPVLYHLIFMSFLSSYRKGKLRPTISQVITQPGSQHTLRISKLVILSDFWQILQAVIYPCLEKYPLTCPLCMVCSSAIGKCDQTLPLLTDQDIYEQGPESLS